MIYKICTKCGEYKSLDEYRRNKNNPDGREYQCRDCRKAIGLIFHITEERIANDTLTILKVKPYLSKRRCNGVIIGVQHSKD